MQARSYLLPLLRSPLVGDLLGWLYLNPDLSFSQTELAARFGVSQATISREADRLVKAGLIRGTRRGTMRLLQADLDHALARPLTELLTLTYGPVAVLSRVLAEVNDIDEAYIYGSWAARYSGEAGPPPRDLDVVVVGEADDDEVFDAARAAERQLGREVNIHRVSASAWRRPGRDPFLSAVRSRPLVSLDLGKDDS